jgi:hypothetical protein
MRFTDVLIIYLACGAPVGVYFYFQNRRLYSKHLWLKTILNFVFWIPLFLQIILKRRIPYVFSKNHFDSETKAENENKLLIVQRKIENILIENNLKISIYEFREVFDRFAGLTTACANNKTKSYKHEKAFYQISGFHDHELSARCLHRRNQKRLYFHQRKAEKDFLQMIAGISDSVDNQAELSHLSVKYVKLLSNSRAEKALTEIFAGELQTGRKISVTNLEKDLWMPDTHKPQPASRISMRLQTISKKASLSVRD